MVKVTPEELKRKINSLNIWKRGDQRAPHKPLLILLFLGRLTKGEPRLELYEEVREDLRSLLEEFGPPRKRQEPRHPFIRLTTDSIWDLKAESKIESPTEWGERTLINNKVRGGFKEEVEVLFKENPGLIKEISEMLLERNFPSTLQQDILNQVGLDLDGFEEGAIKKKPRSRDPKFRENILRAYEYSCAVCGFNVRLGNNLVAVEASHIKWYQAGGPDLINNGIALCTMHHKLFDRGVFSFNDELIFKVAENAHGANGFEEWLMKFHGEKIRFPQRPEYVPNDEYIGWHIREVFKGPARY